MKFSVIHFSLSSSRVFFVGILVLFLASACLSSAIDIKPEDDGTPSTTVVKLNKNVNGLRDLANACIQLDSIAVFSFEYNDDGSVLYWLSLKEGGDIELYSEIVSEEFLVPELSMVRVENEFYWTVNGEILTDSKGRRVSVTDLSKPLSFVLHGDSICCRIKRTTVREYPATRADYLAKDVAYDYDSDNKY